MRNTVHNVGRVGIVRDTKPHLLGSEFWTNGRNVRFEPNRVFGMKGVQSFATKTGVLNCGLIASPLNEAVVYSDGTQVYANDGAVEYNISRTSGGNYAEDLDILFDIISYNGYALFNNGIDLPQTWDPTSYLNKMTALVNWDSNWVAGVLRPFKSLLIALDLTESAVRYPQKLRWSHPAEPGALPTSWDESNPAYDAGEFNFADTTKGFLVNGLEMGEYFYVYKEGAIWELSYVQGTAIISRRLLVDDIGLRVKRSLINLPYFMGANRKVQFFAGESSFYLWYRS